ncbi:MAG: hypothetical protein AAGD40_08070 [Pseudomonadota bacterium]
MSFSINDAWTETVADLKVHAGRYLLPAAAFLFFPTLVVEVLTPPLVDLKTDLIDPALTGPRAFASIAAIPGYLAIIAIALGITGHEGPAIRRALTLFPAALGVTILTGLATMAGLTLLILPGLFLFARFFVALPALADGETRVLDAIRTSWEATEGRWAPILGGALLLIIGATFAGAVAGLIGALIGGTTPEGAPPSLPAALAQTGMGAVAGTLITVFQAKVWRELQANRLPG